MRFVVIYPAMFVSSVARVHLRRCFLMHKAARKKSRQLLLISLLSLLASACDRQTPPDVATNAAATPAKAEFVGSEACSDCHTAEYTAWQDSHHARAMQPATAETVRGDFSDVEFRYFDTSSRFFTRNGQYFVATDDADGESRDFQISHTFGVYPLQQYLVELPGGRLQALSIAWDDRDESEGGQRWYHLYPDEFIAPDDELHWTGRAQNWNYMCAECHSTNLQKHYSLASDTFNTTWSEVNVGCEGCHGPASVHVQRATGQSSRSDSGLVVDLDDRGRATWDMNPDTGIASRSELRMQPPVQPETCGRCHARRATLTENYDYDRSLLDSHLPALLDENLYFPDGQIRDEVYVYGSFLQSRMYQAGVSCSDCHDPHTATLRGGGAPSDVCSTCHLPQKFASRDHSRHEPASAACVDCHMPDRTYMGVDDRRDHSFRIPRPDISLATGSPDACTNCHSDEDASWANAAFRDWFGDDMPAHFGEVFHGAQMGAIGANEALLLTISDEQVPGIARGTALSLLRGPFPAPVAEAVRASLSGADPFVRIGALRALANIQPEVRAEWAVGLLADPLRAVRIEAVRALAPARGHLSAQNDAWYVRAEAELLESAAASAEWPITHVNLGNYYVEAGNYASAENQLRTAMRLDPESSVPILNLADVYRQTDRDSDAEELIQQALQNDPDNAALRHSLALLYVRSQRPEQALDELEFAATADPENARYVYVYGVALHSVGEVDRALAVLQEAAERFPESFDIQWARATILRDLGRFDEARSIALLMIERYPGNASVQSLIQSLQGL